MWFAAVLLTSAFSAFSAVSPFLLLLPLCGLSDLCGRSGHQPAPIPCHLPLSNMRYVFGVFSDDLRLRISRSRYCERNKKNFEKPRSPETATDLFSAQRASTSWAAWPHWPITTATTVRSADLRWSEDSRLDAQDVRCHRVIGLPNRQVVVQCSRLRPVRGAAELYSLHGAGAGVARPCLSASGHLAEFPCDIACIRPAQRWRGRASRQRARP